MKSDKTWNKEMQESKETRSVLETSLNYISNVGYSTYLENGSFPQALLMEQICSVLGKDRKETMEVLDPENFCGKDNIQRLLEKWPLNSEEKELFEKYFDRTDNQLYYVQIIKSYRYRTGLSLKTAKSVIDYVRNDYLDKLGYELFDIRATSEEGNVNDLWKDRDLCDLHDEISQGTSKNETN